MIWNAPIPAWKQRACTDVCPNDPFCDLDAAHEGECRQPFETEYRPGACSPVLWVIRRQQEAERERLALVTRPMDPSTVEQGGLFG